MPNNNTSSIDTVENAHYALTPRWVGYLGLIPFIASSLFIWSPQYHQFALQSLSIYAAVILTFIGSVHWGIAMQHIGKTNKQNSNMQFVFSIIPSLFAWIVILFFETYALIILALGFVTFWWFEKSNYQDVLPAWYSKLRMHLTMIATLSIMIGWFGTL